MLRFDVAGLPDAEKQNITRFTEEVKARVLDLQAQPTSELKLYFLYGIASKYNISTEAVVNAIKSGQQVEQTRKAAIDNSPSGIRKALPILAYMLGSYLLASHSPSGFARVAIQTIAKDLLAELFGPDAKKLINTLCLTLHAWDYFAPDSYPLPFSFRDAINSQIPAIEETCGRGIYFAAPVLTGLYNVSKGSILRCATATGRAAHAFFEACEDFSDVIHGQGRYFDDEPSSPACSSSQP